MTLDEQIRSGDDARAVLENPAFAQAFASIKEELIQQWLNAPARDLTGKEHLWNLHKLTEKLEMALRSTVDTGVLAREQLRHERTVLERAKSAIGLPY